MPGSKVVAMTHNFTFQGCLTPSSKHADVPELQHHTTAHSYLCHGYHQNVVCTQVLVPGPKGSVMTRNFTFHGCLTPSSKQADVLKICGITQLLSAAMAGYHATIFAYGQTGSGKTYTMSGREDVIDSEDYAGAVLCCACAVLVLCLYCAMLALCLASTYIMMNSPHLRSLSCCQVCFCGL